MSLCFLFSITANAQSYRITNRTKIYAEELTGDTVIIKADNSLAIPVSVQLLLKLENLASNTSDTVLAVVEPQATGKSLAILYPKKTDSRFKYTYSWRVIPGDITKSAGNYQYRFPYLKDAYYKISQGPFGSFSHQNMYAFDFLMPVGTSVCAARDGIIALVKNDSEKGGPDRKYIEDANFITVYHNDGTMANYCHLSKNGIKVKEGQAIKQGQVIAVSGNTGFSNGPHLHFEVVRPNIATDLKQWVKFLWEPSTSKPDWVINF